MSTDILMAGLKVSILGLSGVFAVLMLCYFTTKLMLIIGRRIGTKYTKQE